MSYDLRVLDSKDLIKHVEWKGNKNPNVDIWYNAGFFAKNEYIMAE